MSIRLFFAKMLAMASSLYLKLKLPRALALLSLLWFLTGSSTSRAAFGPNPLLFLSERPDLHMKVRRAHSNFLKDDQGEKYIYGMRTQDNDQLFNADEFYKRVDERRKESPKAPIIVFVHGCCVSFGEQMLQANDLEKAVDSSYARSPGESAGRPLMISYDWVAPFYYNDSLENCYSAQNRFDTFMEDLVRRYGSGNVIIVAHSLGTLLVQNYANQVKDLAQGRPPFQAIIFSRADVDRDSFLTCLPALKACSQRMIALCADNDPNLFASSFLRKVGVKFARAASLPAKLPQQLAKKIETGGGSGASQSAVSPGGSPDGPAVTGDDAGERRTISSSEKVVNLASALDEPGQNNSEMKMHKAQTKRLGQVKVATEFSSKMEVYDVSPMRIGHGIPYTFIGDILFHNPDNYDLQKDVTGVVTVRHARP